MLSTNPSKQLRVWPPRLKLDLLPVVAEYKSVVAIASVAARNISASSVLANGRIQLALVQVLAFVRAENLPVSFRTNAHEAADEVLARVRTIVCRSLTLVQVHAMNAVRVQRVAGGAHAAERSVRVEAPFGDLGVINEERGGGKF